MPSSLQSTPVYIWDDDALLTANAQVSDPHSLTQIWEGKNSRDYTPLATTTYWLEWRLWGAGEPMGYHIINLLLHALVARVTKWRNLAGPRIPGAWLGALFFAIHPVSAASAAWIAELKNTLSSVFFFGSSPGIPDCIHPQGQPVDCRLRRSSSCSRGWSKGAVVTLPIVLAGCLLWMFGKITRSDLLRLLPFFLIALAVAWLTIHFQSGAENYGLIPDSKPYRIARAGNAVWRYLRRNHLPGLLGAPSPLNGASICMRLSPGSPRWPP